MIGDSHQYILIEVWTSEIRRFAFARGKFGTYLPVSGRVSIVKAYAQNEPGSEVRMTVRNKYGRAAIGTPYGRSHMHPMLHQAEYTECGWNGYESVYKA